MSPNLKTRKAVNLSLQIVCSAFKVVNYYSTTHIKT